MKSLRRFTASIVSSFDAVVGQLENHEALVASAIRDAEEAAGRAKGQLGRVQKDGVNMRRKLQETRDQAELWEGRAKKCSHINEQKALECLRRRQKLLKQAGQMEEQSVQHHKLEKQLGNDLIAIQEKLVALRQQRNLLRTRQSRAEALRLVQSCDSAAMGEIDDIFDRWEARISASEELGFSSRAAPDDSLNQEFISSEEEHELKALLATLVAEGEQR